MQKLDFVQALDKVYKDMFSEDIVSDYKISSTPGFSKYGKELATQLFEIFSNYNALKKEKPYSLILSALDADDLFSADNFTKLFNLFQGDIGKIDYILNREFRTFIDFHFALKATHDFAEKLLVTKEIRKSIGLHGENGILVFQVFNDRDGLAMKVYVEIFKTLDTLVENVSRLHGEEAIESEVILVDSGSDINIAIQMGVGTATTIFLLFKYVHDFHVFRRNDKEDRDTKSITDKLNLLTELDKQVQSGRLTEAEGKLYSYKVKSSINSLMDLSVMPKELRQIQNENFNYLLKSGPAGLLSDGSNEEEGTDDSIKG